MRIIIAGSRDINDYNLICKEVNDIIRDTDNKDIQIISGACKGVDKLGERYAKENNITLKKFPADWQNLESDICLIKQNKYGKYNALAGIDRNQKMVDYASLKDGILIAFIKNNSNGTKDIIKRAKKANLKTFIFEV